MKWFKHDSDANMDAKLQEVLLDHGLEGFGLYWYCIELISQKVNANNLTFELEHDCRIIARNTGSTVAKIETIMRDFVRLGLFNADNGHVFCLKLAKRCDDFTAKLVKAEQQKRLVNQEVGESPTKTEKVRIDKTRLDKNRLDNKDTSREKIIDDVIGFLNFTTNQNYRKNGKATRKIINARLDDKYTVDELKIVISSKAKDWLGTEHQIYLRPETLFANSKIEGYLNAANNKTQISPSNNFSKPQLQDLSVTLDDNSWANNIDDVL